MSTIEQLEERIRRLEYGLKGLKSQRDYSFSPMNDTLKIDHIKEVTASHKITFDNDVTGAHINTTSDFSKNSTEGYLFVPLAAPLTSTDWDGDARSTTAKTLIDLSVVFGAPAGVKAVYVNVGARDSASGATTGLFVLLGPTDTAAVGSAICRPSGLPNDYYDHTEGIIPCDANGDIYYQIVASGVGTMDVFLTIWGYWI